MRVFTFQSEEVVNRIIEDGIYFADKSKAREGSISQEDFNVYNRYPIWFFHTHVTMHSLPIDMHYWKEQMSINTLKDKLLLELEIPDVYYPVSTSHNASGQVKIIDCIKKEYLIAVYNIKEKDWYHHIITNKKKLRDTYCLTDTMLDTEKLYEYRERWKDVCKTIRHTLQRKETLCEKCGEPIKVLSGLVEGTPIETSCHCGYMNYKEIWYMKEFSRGKRKWNHSLTGEEKMMILNEAKRLEIPDYVCEFISDPSQGTAYIPDEDIIHIGGNILPDDEHPENVQDKMPVACVLAHEWYGHRKRRQEYLEGKIFEYDTDEALASRDAARYCPNLSKEEKLYLYSHVTMHVALGDYDNLLTIEEKQFLLGMIDNVNVNDNLITRIMNETINKNS